MFLIIKLFLLWTGLFPVSHAYHVSTLEVGFNPYSRKLEMSLKIHTEDLAKFYELTTETSAGNIDTLSSSFELWLSSYLVESIHFEIKGNPVSLFYVGYENETYNTWCYFESEKLGLFSQIQVTSSLFCEKLLDQVNIINVDMESIQKSVRLTCESPMGIIVLE